MWAPVGITRASRRGCRRRARRPGDPGGFAPPPTTATGRVVHCTRSIVMNSHARDCHPRAPTPSWIGTTRSRARQRMSTCGLDHAWRRWFHIDRCHCVPIPVYGCRPTAPSTEIATPCYKLVHQHDDSEDPRRGTLPPLGFRPCCQRSLLQSHWKLTFQGGVTARTRYWLPAASLPRSGCPAG